MTAYDSSEFRDLAKRHGRGDGECDPVENNPLRRGALQLLSLPLLEAIRATFKAMWIRLLASAAQLPLLKCNGDPG